MHVPTHMYKITILHKNNQHYIAAFLMPNKPSTNTDLSNYLIHPIVLCGLIKSTMTCDIDDCLERAAILRKHNRSVGPVESIHQWIKSIEPIEVSPTKQLQLAMASSELYGKLVYASSMEQLNTAFQRGKDQKLINQFHELYYKLAKQRLNGSKN